MQKALTQMNLKLHHVLSDLTGVTGMAIVRDILAGVRDPEALAAHRDGRCKASEAEIAASLTGHYRPEHLFVLRQNFEAFEFHQRQIAQCDQAIEAQLARLADSRSPASSELPAARPRGKFSKNEPCGELRAPLHRITGGADLSQIDGIGPYGALQLIAEIGRYESLAHREALYRLADAGAQQQDLRRPTAQFRDSTLGQSPIARRRSCAAVR